MAVTVDLHTHILYGVDDGAENFEESMQMLEIASRNGTTDIVLTPHYLSRDMRGLKMNKAELEHRFEDFKRNAAGRFPQLNLYLGAEVFAVSNMYEVLEDGQLVTINGTKYVLLEFRFDDNFQRAYNVAASLIERGYIPIIAHPERYSFINEDPMAILPFTDAGALLQVNTSSLEGSNGPLAQDVAMSLIENNMVASVSSDCHSMFRRTPDLSEAYEFISSVFSSAYAEDLFYNNPIAIIRGKRI